MTLDFRAGTALFGHFGVEWDLSTATEDDLHRLSRWIQVYRRHRPLLHGGRLTRLDQETGGAWVHGVVAPDRSAAIMAYVQLDEVPHEPPRFRVPGLDGGRSYTISRIDPSQLPVYEVPATAVSGAVLGDLGLPGPPPAPQTIVVLLLSAG